MSEHIVTESELILPALWLMCHRHNGTISTSDLIKDLTNIIKPTGIDAKILSNRSDTYFSQKVRNLKSHNTFEKKGYARGVDGGFQITESGRALVKATGDAFSHLITSDYNYTDILQGADNLLNTPINRPVIPLDEIVREGKPHIRNHKVYERSHKLRDAAIETFMHDGKIFCDCCNFEFGYFYGEHYGVSCIEIHHVKPLFTYEDEDMILTIEQCLPNLIPVCPNCHRVIHRNRISALEMSDFKQTIKTYFHAS